MPVRKWKGQTDTGQTDARPRMPPDQLGCRLGWGLLASVLVNLALWRAMAQIVRNHIPAPPPPLTFRRIFLPRSVHAKPRKKAIRHVAKPKPKPPLRIKPPVKVKPRVRPIFVPHPIIRPHPPEPRPVAHLRPAPPAAHHHIITAKGPTAATQTALPGGHSQLGTPIPYQNTSQRRDNNVVPAPQPPNPQPASPPTVPTSPPVSPPPQPAPQPKPEPAPPPKPAPPPPSGPTQDAQPENQVLPDIPSDLTDASYSSSVHVKVAVAADGSFRVTLLSSSGNEEVDQRVVDALKKWKWKPALQNGQPVASTQRFRFDFQVQ